MMRTIFQATKEVLKEKVYLAITISIAVLIILSYIWLPILTIPGNSLGIQLRLIQPTDFILIVLLSFSIGLLISMLIYNYRIKKRNAAINTGKGIMAIIAGFVGTMFVSLTCASCLAAVLPFLGAGSILFLAANQLYILIVTFGVVAVLLYSTSRSVLNTCKECG